jgi:hypothetical protein
MDETNFYYITTDEQIISPEENKTLNDFCSKNNIDKSLCKAYGMYDYNCSMNVDNLLVLKQHLYFIHKLLARLKDNNIYKYKCIVGDEIPKILLLKYIFYFLLY